MNRRSVDLLFSDGGDPELGLLVPQEDIELMAKHATGKRLLDAGCGGARYSESFLRLGFEYTGIDISDKALERARIRNPSLIFRRMSYQNLSFPDGSFDCVWCCCSLTYTAKKNAPRVLHEIMRVLAPSGIAAILMPDTGVSDEFVNSLDGRDVYLALWTASEFFELIMMDGYRSIENIQRSYNGSMLFVIGK